MEPGHGEGDGGSHPSGRPSRQGPFGDGFDIAGVGNVENVAESKSVEAGARRDVAVGPCRTRQEAEQRRKIAARPSTRRRLSAALRFGEIRGVANIGDVANVVARDLRPGTAGRRQIAAEHLEAGRLASLAGIGASDIVLLDIPPCGARDGPRHERKRNRRRPLAVRGMMMCRGRRRFRLSQGRRGRREHSRQSKATAIPMRGAAAGRSVKTVSARCCSLLDVANVGDVGDVAGRGDPVPVLQGETCEQPTGVTSASRFDEGLPRGEVEPARAPRFAGEPLPTGDGDSRPGAAFALRAESSRDRRRRVIRAERPAADIPNRAAT